MRESESGVSRVPVRGEGALTRLLIASPTWTDERSDRLFERDYGQGRSSSLVRDRSLTRAAL